MNEPNISNPLLSITTQIPFDRIGADDFEPAVEHLIEIAQKQLPNEGPVSKPFCYQLRQVQRLPE